jgi:hypothetical protein
MADARRKRGPALPQEHVDLARQHQATETTPIGDNLLGPTTVVCLILNRTIGAAPLLFSLDMAR